MNKGFELPSVYVIDRPLALITHALELNVVVDSPFEYQLERADYSQVRTDEERTLVQREMTSIGSADECLRRLCEMDSKPTHGFTTFVRRFGFGIRSRTAPVRLANN